MDLQQPMTLAERRSAVEAAAAALRGLDEVLTQASAEELPELLTLVDQVAARAGAARVTVTAEAVARGEVGESGMNAHAWVREHAPSLRQGGAGHVASLAAQAARRVSPSDPRRVVDADPESALGMVWAGVKCGTVSPALGMATLREAARLDPLLREEAKPTVTRALLELGVAWGPGMMRRLRPRLLAEHGRSGVLDEIQDRLAPAARLSAPFVESGDLTEYQLLMTPEQAAALEAAIGPLSAAAPNPVTGERDLRPAGQRRVEALTEVCRRSAALDAEAQGADGAGASPAAVHVIVKLTDLEQRTGCGEVVGSSASGTVLSPEVLRRVCCEADLVPHVLGTEGEDLDLGRVARLFTRAQRRALWRRDQGCTFPGCGAPASWCRAHHVVHWLDGGRTDLANAALLCQRHHTHVHARRLVAQVRGRPEERGRYVTWDLSPGSYDRHLERLRAELAAHDPPPLTPDRLRELVALVTRADHPDQSRWLDPEPDWQRWADHELAEAVVACGADPGPPGEDLTDEYWRDNEAQFDTAC